ncbi:MAG: proprotein convertase P-domain-containing protein, partial [Planctomycetota bacterium]
RRRDLNSDTQITMAEFAEQWTEEKVAEFGKYDLNGDGIITPDECVGASSLPKGTYRNHRLQIISAGATVYSEITVTDEEPIGDLDVQISITHTYDSRLDAFLIGPYGDRVELFTAVGRDDDHFHNTVFDDEARRPITEGRPPFAGSYRPEATAKRQPSLRQFYGKPIDGTWTLMIQAGRSDRPGALHGWSLIATPAGDEGSEEPNRPEPDRSERDRSQRDRPERDRSEGNRPLFRRPRR